MSLRAAPIDGSAGAPSARGGRAAGHVVLHHSPLAWLLIGFIRLWRAIVSPLYGDVCKFYPTCSSYGLSAVETHGALRGSWLIVRRLARCHPWSLGGYDPVPGTAGAAGAHRHETPDAFHPRFPQGDRPS